MSRKKGGKNNQNRPAGDGAPREGPHNNADTSPASNAPNSGKAVLTSGPLTPEPPPSAKVPQREETTPVQPIPANKTSSFKKSLRDFLFNPGWLFWVMTGCSLVAIKCVHEGFSHGTPWDTAWLKSLCLFLGELGIAFLVFALVSITIEKFAREDMLEERERQFKEHTTLYQDNIKTTTDAHQKNIKEIKKSLFQNILGLMLPKEMFEELLKTVFGHNLFRKNYEIRYEFSNCPGNDKLLLVTKTVRYELHNISSTASTPTLRHYSESMTAHPDHPNRFVFFQIRWGKNKTETWNEQRLKDEKLRWNDNFRYGMEMQSPIAVEPDDHIKITLKHISVRRMYDCDVYVTQLPAVGMKITAIVRDNIKLTFQPDSAHRVDPVRISEDGSDTMDWEIREPFLPNQGFMLFWGPPATVATNGIGTNLSANR